MDGASDERLLEAVVNGLIRAFIAQGITHSGAATGPQRKTFKQRTVATTDLFSSCVCRLREGAEEGAASIKIQRRADPPLLLSKFVSGSGREQPGRCQAGQPIP